MPELNKQALDAAITAIAKSVTHSHHGDAVTAIQAYLDALPEQEDWQPIETAPDNGKTIIVCWGPDYVPEQAMWDLGTKQWVKSVWQQRPLDHPEGNEPTPFEEPPTLWMHNPSPPKAALSPLPNTHEEDK